MNIGIIEERLKQYAANSAETELTAIREITQELILFALSTSDFFSHAALDQTGPWAGLGLAADRSWYIEQMSKRIESIDWKQAKEDIAPFISPQEQRLLSRWSTEFFLSALARLPC